MSSPASDELCSRCGSLLPLNDAGLAQPHECCGCLDDGFVKGGGPCPFCTRERDPLDVWARCGIPPVFALEDLTTWRPQDGEQVEACRAFIEAWPPDPWMLTLIGGTGTGKSHLAAGIIKAAYWKHRKGGRYVDALSLMRRFRATQGDTKREEEGDVLRAYLAPDVLVIDECGFGRMTGYAIEMLHVVINERWAGKRATVVTMNDDGLDAMDLRDQSRLGSGRVVEFRQGDARANVRP